MRKRMKEVEDARDDANTGMGTFQLKPRHLEGEELFHHMVQRRIFDPTNQIT
jgi:hypothetical protein